MRLAALLIGLLCLTLPAHAETRVALVIGNAAYERAGNLPNAANDAVLMSQGLRSMGFDVTELTDLDEDGMGDALDAFAAKAAASDVAAFYFAGHGLQYERVNYLIPVDARLSSAAAIQRETLSVDQVMQALNAAPLSMIFLDACRNNPFAEDLLAKAQSAGRSVAVSRGLAVVQARGDQLVVFATLPNAVASDGSLGNSPFARALERHMKTPGVEVSVVMKRVTADVMAETGGDQRPQQLSQMQREFYFAAPPGAIPRPAVPEPLLSVYPGKVSVGDEVAMIADLPHSCTPFFFALAPSGKVTPIPRRFFRTVELSSGQTRYEISPGSRYGLTVLPEDEKGAHTIGYVCEPPAGTGTDALKALLRQAVGAAQQGTEDGTIKAAGITSAFQLRPFTIQ